MRHSLTSLTNKRLHLLLLTNDYICASFRPNTSKMREKSCKGRDPSSTPKGPKNRSRRACEHINHPRKEVNETRADAKERTNITGFWSGGGIWSTYDQYEQQ